MKLVAPLLASSLALVAGHGHLVVPAPRNGGSLAVGGSCSEQQCYWFSNNVEIPGEMTLPERFRTTNQAAAAGSESDVYKTSPWRAPGSAPVYGSGCGVAGGGPTAFANGGFAPKGVEQGLDALKLAPTNITKWTRGATAEVAWGISANHGGGYTYRLCPKNATVTEACFQAHGLKFAGQNSWIVHPDGSKSEPFKRIDVTEGVFPEGSSWAVGPVPACNTCDPYETCGSPMTPVPGPGKSDWDNQVNCYGLCDGAGSSKAGGKCPEGTANFPEPLPGISGFGKYSWPWSVMDLVEVPTGLPTGDYLLSWRWDCEESTQVWENCADIQLV